MSAISSASRFRGEHHVIRTRQAPPRTPDWRHRASGETTMSPAPAKRRRALLTGGMAALALPASAQSFVDLPIANGRRQLVASPEKRPLIVLTTRPPQLETPFEVFNDGLITP